MSLTAPHTDNCASQTESDAKEHSLTQCCFNVTALDEIIRNDWAYKCDHNKVSDECDSEVHSCTHVICTSFTTSWMFLMTVWTKPLSLEETSNRSVFWQVGSPGVSPVMVDYLSTPRVFFIQMQSCGEFQHNFSDILLRYFADKGTIVR